jgi:glycosyltransferase involved in cell wall biosynthesis
MRVVMIDTANQAPYYTYPLCRALASEGCQIELITAPYIYEALPPTGIVERHLFGRTSTLPVLRRSQRLRQLARGIEYPLDWAAALRRVRLLRPDVVHVQWAMLPPVDALTFQAIRRLGPRLVYTVHDIEPHYGRWRRLLLSQRPLFQASDDLLVYTERMKLNLCASAGLSPSKVHVVGTGNQVEWSGAALERQVARSQLELPGEAPLLLFFGSIKPYKRLGLVLEALPSVVERVPEVRLVIAGRLAEPFDRYQRTIERLQLTDHVIKRLGYVPEAQLPAYFSAADAVVLAHAEADFSAVLAVAQAYGRAVVATETGEFGDLIADGESGLLAPADDARGLGERLALLLADRSLAAQMGARARELSHQRFGWRNNVGATMQVYRGELEASDRSRIANATPQARDRAG